LGAGRLELFRQIAVESMLLTMTAGVISCGLAAVLVEISRVYLPAAIGPAASAIAIDYRVIKVVLLSSIALGMLVALIPFLSVLSTLHKEGIQVGIKSGFAKVTDIALAPAQLAISVVLLVCAFLMYKSFQSILAVPPGFDPAHLVQARIALPATYTAPGPSTSMRNRVLTAVRSIPGVERAAAVSNFGVGPASSFPTQTFVLKRDVAVPHNPEVIVDYVSPEFFETMRIALISGRFFSESDDARAEGFLIVDDAFVRRYFPGRDPLGEEIALASSRSSPDLRWATIIGVVRRANLTGLEGRDGLPFVFCPLGSRSTPGFNIVLRSSRPKDEVIADIRAKLRSVDSTLPLYSEGTVQGAIAGLLMPRRVAIALLTVFCLLAVSLAGIGVFGVLSYNVSQRTKEIGIRIAIGASPLKVVYLIVGHGLYRAGVGIGTGLLCSLFLVRYTRSMLFDTAPTDASAFALVPLILFAIVLLACWHPARKAVNTDPMVALRSE
jgi:predicted permease